MNAKDVIKMFPELSIHKAGKYIKQFKEDYSMVGFNFPTNCNMRNSNATDITQAFEEWYFDSYLNY